MPVWAGTIFLVIGFAAIGWAGFSFLLKIMLASRGPQPIVSETISSILFSLNDLVLFVLGVLLVAYSLLSLARSRRAEPRKTRPPYEGTRTDADAGVE
jgi:hypothetical protein